MEIEVMNILIDNCILINTDTSQRIYQMLLCCNFWTIEKKLIIICTYIDTD